MVSKRNMDPNEMKSKPKKRRISRKTLQSQSAILNKIQTIRDLKKGCLNGNVEIVKQILKVNLTLEINQQITPKEIQEMKLLHTASENGNIEIVKELLNCNLDIDEKDEEEDGKTALHMAAENGHAAIVATLLSHGANVNLKDDETENALHKASKLGHIDVVREILKHGCDNIDDTIGGKTALHLATQSNQAQIVAMLLEHCADVNFHLDEFKYIDDVESYCFWSGDTRAIHTAARHGYDDVMKELLKYDVEIDVRTMYKDTALHLASERGHASVVAQILDHGANVYLTSEHPDIVSEKSLHMASQRGHLEVVKELLKYDKKINGKNEDGKTPLHLASENGQTKTVKELLHHGARIDLHVGSNREGCYGLDCDSYCYPEGNVLHLAIKSGNVETVQLLLNSGAKLKQKCTSNYFLDACQHGHLEVVKELIKRGANIHEQIDYKQKISPLHVAICHKNIEVVKELLSQGANVNHEDIYYGTPINVAVNDGNLILVKELLKSGANPYQKLVEYGYGEDYRSEETPIWVALEKGHHSIVEELLLYAENDAIVYDDWTPLHYATFIGHKGSVTKLLARGCNPNVFNKYHETPLHFAIDFAPDADSIVIVKDLLDHGANINIKADSGATAFHKAFASYDIKKNENIIHILM